MTHHPDKVAARNAKIKARWDHEAAIRKIGYDINDIDRKIVLAALEWARCDGDDEGMALCTLSHKRDELTAKLKTLKAE